MRASSVVMQPLFPTARTLDDNTLYRLINRLTPTAPALRAILDRLALSPGAQLVGRETICRDSTH